MTRVRWWWVGMVSLLMIAGALEGCSEGEHGDDRHGSGVCFLVSEVEPNATSRTAQFLDHLFVDDCFIVAGSILTATDVDSYRVLIRENLTLAVALDHSLLADFDILLFDADTGQLIRDCGASVVPEVCAVSFVVLSGAIAVDVVVLSEVGAGTYTLTLDAQ